MTVSKPRLAYVQQEESEDFSSLIKRYVEWRDFKEYLVLSKPSLRKPYSENKYIFVECRKRGNAKYCRMLDMKLKHFIKSFWIKNFKTYGLFITLTCKTGRWYGREWEDINRRFNQFLNWIRRRIKKKRGKRDFVGIYRVTEATKKGYPHIHFCLFTRSPLFIPHKLCNKRWGAYTWISRIRSIPAVMNYLRKYLSKTYQNDEHLLTAALLWYYRKRSFAISSSLLFYLIQEKRNAFKNLKIAGLLNPQVNLYGEIIEEKWSYVGIMTRLEIKNEGLIGVFV